MDSEEVSYTRVKSGIICFGSFCDYLKKSTASNGKANKNIGSDRLTFSSLAVTSSTTGCNNKKILHCAHNVRSCVLHVSQK